jgi:hypothetical protein
MWGDQTASPAIVERRAEQLKQLAARVRGTRALIVAAIIATMFAAPGWALAGTVTQTAQFGRVSATFTFDQSGSSYSQLQLQIARSGQVVYDEPVSSQYCSLGNGCSPGGFGQSRVRVLPLQPGIEPDVVLALYTGGAHCCDVDQVFSYSPSFAGYAMHGRRERVKFTEWIRVGSHREKVVFARIYHSC